jgi:hypothetical protein
MKTSEKQHILVYDFEAMRPGCAILQAAMGGTVCATLFPSECWQLSPDNLKPYILTDSELEKVIAYHKGKPRRPAAHV